MKIDGFDLNFTYLGDIDLVHAESRSRGEKSGDNEKLHGGN